MTTDVWSGSIPAWAGEPLKPRMVAKISPVYPRVGRGNLQHTNGDFSEKRSIPAWAGEPTY